MSEEQQKQEQKPQPNERALAVLKEKELPTLKALFSLISRPGTDNEALALQEISYLTEVFFNKPDLATCHVQSIIMAVKYSIKNGLTLDPRAGLTYVKSRNVVIGKDAAGKDIKVKRLDIDPTANGLISMYRQTGRILDVQRPKVVKDKDNKVIEVIAKFLLPSYDAAGKTATRWEEFEFDESDFHRWKVASHRENGRWKSDFNSLAKDDTRYANPLFTSFNKGLDPEFARAKAIRHALKKLGSNQNELPVRRTFVDLPQGNYVDITADQQATGDESSGEDGRDDSSIIQDAEVISTQVNETEGTFVSDDDFDPNEL